MTHFTAETSSYNMPEDYHDKFDPQAYISENFRTDNPERVLPLKHLLHFYNTVSVSLDRTLQPSAAGLTILDFGCGPIPIYQISASMFASEIVMADYTEKNRLFLQQRLSRDAAAHDWSPFFDLVVREWEGKTERDAREREDLVRSKIKAVVPCDITRDPPIADKYKGPYDVVFSSLCLEVASKTEEEYTAGVAKLASLVKPGGKLVLFGIFSRNESSGEHTFYSVGSEMFSALCISQDKMFSALNAAGLHNSHIATMSREEIGIPPPVSDSDGLLEYFFLTAIK